MLIVARAAEVGAAPQDLPIKTQLGAQVLHRTTHAVDAALAGDPQIQALAVGFTAEVKAAFGQLLFQVRQRLWLLTWAIEDQTLIASLLSSAALSSLRIN